MAASRWIAKKGKGSHEHGTSRGSCIALSPLRMDTAGLEVKSKGKKTGGKEN